MTVRAISLSGTTAADGSLTVNGNENITGWVECVQTVDGTLDDGVDLTLTAENLNLSFPILAKTDFNTDAVYYPRQLVNAVADGAALTGTAGGDRTRPFINGTLRMVLAQGGNAKTGGVVVYVLDEP